MSMEEKYKGYDIKYDEDRERFEASNGKHRFSYARLKDVRRSIDRQTAHDRGFKPFEAYYFDGGRVRHVRVTSVNQEPRFGYGLERTPTYGVRITYLDKVEDEYGQRSEVEHTSIFALDPETAKQVALLCSMVGDRDRMTAQIEELAEKMKRLKTSDLGIEEGEK
jgi:hypothetical protein